MKRYKLKRVLSDKEVCRLIANTGPLFWEDFEPIEEEECNCDQIFKGPHGCTACDRGLSKEDKEALLPILKKGKSDKEVFDEIVKAEDKPKKKCKCKPILKGSSVCACYIRKHQDQKAYQEYNYPPKPKNLPYIPISSNMTKEQKKIAIHLNTQVDAVNYLLSQNQ